jgi:hypothetical protein
MLDSAIMKRAILSSILPYTALLMVASQDAEAQNPTELRAPSGFSSIADTPARSRASFTEAAKVIMSPRCVNCHPASDRPTQGNDMHPHSPPAPRGADGGGVPGNTCGACHLDRNNNMFVGWGVSFESIPGHPRWGLAPIEMAWEGKTIGEVCLQIKDPQRNGSLELLYEHLARDDLVAWGWNPGSGPRQPSAIGGLNPCLDRQRR